MGSQFHGKNIPAPSLIRILIKIRKHIREISRIHSKENALSQCRMTKAVGATQRPVVRSSRGIMEVNLRKTPLKALQTPKPKRTHVWETSCKAKTRGLTEWSFIWEVDHCKNDGTFATSKLRNNVRHQKLK